MVFNSNQVTLIGEPLVPKKRPSYIISDFRKQLKNISARHKTNANYGNLVYEKVEKRVAKNLLSNSRVKHESHNKFFATLFSTLSYTKFS